MLGGGGRDFFGFSAQQIPFGNNDSQGSLTQSADLAWDDANKVLTINGKISGVTTPAASADAAPKSYVDSKIGGGTVQIAADAGAKNAYTATLNPAITTYTANLLVLLTGISHANDDASTLALNGLAAKPIVTKVNAALEGGEIALHGDYLLRYDGTSFRIVA